MYTLPEASTATPLGMLSLAAPAGPPSPEEPGIPVPAMVEMYSVQAAVGMGVRVREGEAEAEGVEVGVGLGVKLPVGEILNVGVAVGGVAQLKMRTRLLSVSAT